MPFSVEAKNAMLDYLGTLALRMSVHDTVPGSTGTGEISGTTRQAVTWNTASVGAKTQSNNPSFSGIPTGTPVNYIALWNTAGTVYYGYQQVAGTTVSGVGTWTYDVSAGAINLNSQASA